MLRTSLRRIIFGIAVFILTIALAVLGYVIDGASFLDSLYMVVITIFSVGYDEAIPINTTAQKIFTIFVVIVGCSSLLYIIGGFIQMATEGEIARALGAQRMSKEIEQLKNHTIICGFGRMGQIIAKELALSKHSFVIIDSDPDRIKEAETLGFIILNGDATDEDILKEARIDHATSLASVLPNDAMNVFITLSGRNINSDLSILARGELPSTEAKLIQAGANHVVLPAAIGGMRLAHMIVRPSASRLLETLENATMINDDLEQLGVRLSEIHIHQKSELRNRKIGELEIEGEGTFLIVAIQRHSGKIEKRPPSDAIVEGGDTVIVIGYGNIHPKFTLQHTPAQEITWDHE
jgi:voltage-gated potassium channel